ncbi:MAG: hypothetical protein O8C66_08985 [Candidatus Methanoperedens sp.]|nr:hypothetical protein [Candidatus Methanoperedens sp.]MCZ7370631.1 hypothetical protein [Candidatus Methanoperedens sp.]
MENSFLEKRLAESEREVERLRKERSRAKKNEYRNTGYALIAFGAATLAISYFTHNNTTLASILLFAGLGTTYLGILSLFLAPEKFVREEILEKSNLSSLIVINNIIQELQIHSKGIYLMFDDEIRVVLPLKPGNMPRGEALRRTFNLGQSTALVLVPLGYSMMKMAEKEGADFSDIYGALNEVLAKGLELADSVEVAKGSGDITVIINNPLYLNLCEKVSVEAPGICAVGCSFCSMIACIITKSTGKNVVIEQVEHGKNKIITRFSLN